MRRERGVPSIKGTVLGRAPYLTADQLPHVAAYQKRVEAGKIFGGRTDDLLTTDGPIDERLAAYFTEVEAKLDLLHKTYGNGKRTYLGSNFADVKEESMRLMWDYGITTDLFYQDQRGLLLLGVASTNLYLRGKKGDVFDSERRRMNYVVRLLAQYKDSVTTSTKVDELLDRAEWKAADESDPKRAKIYEDRAQIERQFTTSNTTAAVWEERLSDTESIIDKEASARMNTTYRDMPHFQTVLRRNGVVAMPSIDWLVTKYSPDEFTRKYDSSAFFLGTSAYLPQDTDSQNSISSQQHEVGHLLVSYPATTFLGRGFEEADAETAVDNPRAYIPQRLVTYYADDLIDKGLEERGMGKFGERISELVRRSAGRKKMNYVNTFEERAWNGLLLDTFGVEGYLAYFMMDPQLYHVDILKNTLIHPLVAARRLRVFADYYAHREPLPEDTFSGSIQLEVIKQDIVRMWGSSVYKNITQGILDEPLNVAVTLSADQLQDFYHRMLAYTQCFGSTNLLPETIQVTRKIEELAWMKQTHPEVFTKSYLYPPDVFDGMGTALSSETFTEVQVEGVRNLANKVLDHLALVEDLGDATVHNSFVYALLRAASGDYDYKSDEKVQQKFAQALIVVYKQMREVEKGDFTTIVKKMRKEILEPIVENARCSADLVDIFAVQPIQLVPRQVSRVRSVFTAVSSLF